MAIPEGTELCPDCGGSTVKILTLEMAEELGLPDSVGSAVPCPTCGGLGNIPLDLDEEDPLGFDPYDDIDLDAAQLY